MKYIESLTVKVVGNLHSTDEMLVRYRDILTDDLVNNIKHIGVNTRFLADKDSNIRDICVTVGRKCLDGKSVSNLIVASEVHNLQTPGLAPIILPKLGLLPTTNVFNLQGTACSSMPKILKLCEGLEGDTLCIISGITSPMYQVYLEEMYHSKIMPVTKGDNWVSLLFGFLFGDGVAAFIVNDREGRGYNHLGQITNIEPNDFITSCVYRNNMSHADKGTLDKAINYTKELIKLKNIDIKKYGTIILHTGSDKIINAYQKEFDLTDGQLAPSRYVLSRYGNLTGCSLPFIMNKTTSANALMIGISMGFSVDMVEL